MYFIQSQQRNLAYTLGGQNSYRGKSVSVYAFNRWADEGLFSCRSIPVCSPGGGGGVTSIIKVYTDMQLEWGIYFQTIQYINGKLQWDGQVGNRHVFQLAPVIRSDVSIFFSQKYVANIRSIIFQLFCNIIQFNQTSSFIALTTKPLGLNCGRFNPSTNPSRNQWGFFLNPQVNLTCRSWCLIFYTYLHWRGKHVLISTGFSKPDDLRMGFTLTRRYEDGFFKPVNVGEFMR